MTRTKFARIRRKQADALMAEAEAFVHQANALLAKSKTPVRQHQAHYLMGEAKTLMEKATALLEESESKQAYQNMDEVLLAQLEEPKPIKDKDLLDSAEKDAELERYIRAKSASLESGDVLDINLHDSRLSPSADEDITSPWIDHILDENNNPVYFPPERFIIDYDQANGEELQFAVLNDGLLPNSAMRLVKSRTVADEPPTKSQLEHQAKIQARTQVQVQVKQSEKLSKSEWEQRLGVPIIRSECKRPHPIGPDDELPEWVTENHINLIGRDWFNGKRLYENYRDLDFSQYSAHDDDFYQDPRIEVLNGVVFHYVTAQNSDLECLVEGDPRFLTEEDLAELYAQEIDEKLERRRRQIQRSRCRLAYLNNLPWLQHLPERRLEEVTMSDAYYPEEYTALCVNWYDRQTGELLPHYKTPAARRAAKKLERSRRSRHLASAQEVRNPKIRAAKLSERARRTKDRQEFERACRLARL